MKLSSLFSFAPYQLRLLALGAFLALGTSACEVTDLQPQDAISEQAAFSNPDRVALAVTGVYNAAQSGYYDALNGTALGTRGYPFGAAGTALGDARGEDVVDIAGFFLIVYSNNITTASPNIVNMWSNLYSVVNQANVVIEGVRGAAQSGIIPAATATAYEGELRFLRALAYHELVINFSKPYLDGNGSTPGVPYRDFPVNTAASLEQARNIDRGTVANVYTKILEDLDYAETNLPADRSGTLKITRATKGAAIALKQRVRLHQGNWTQAQAEGNKLISTVPTNPGPTATGGYTLLSSPELVWPSRSPATSENIFSIENSTDDGATTNGSLGSIFGSPNAPTATPAGISGRGLLAVSPILYNASYWPCDDKRRTLLTVRAADGRYYLTKYKDAATYADWAPLIRYSEVLLNQAEAEARLNNTARGLELLNAVRNRSVPAGSGRYTSFASANALIQAILNERRIELVGEGFRYDDLSRLSKDANFAPLPNGGIPAKFTTAQTVTANYNCGGTTLTGSTAAIPYTDYRFLWPIPSTEVTNNPLLAGQQNPGY